MSVLKIKDLLEINDYTYGQLWPLMNKQTLTILAAIAVLILMSQPAVADEHEETAEGESIQ